MESISSPQSSIRAGASEPGGEDVDDAASPADEPRYVDDGLDRVAHASPEVEGIVEVDGISDLQRVQAGLEGLACDGLLRQRHGRADDDEGPALGPGLQDGGEGVEPLLCGVDVGHQPFERECLRLREVEDERVGVGPDKELIVEAAGVIGPGRDDDHRHARCAK